ncbi:MAG: LacI family transcriptional regulator [Armatimonadota bacterium]|nr:LacI family transcriptional regulator [Armatimonadota bacterium]
MPRKLNSSTDVARLAGVSQATVSYVLNASGGKSISEETRQRVFEAARQLGYRSNRLSHGVLRGRTGLIGVVIPRIDHSFYGGILQGIHAECAAQDYHVLLTRAWDEQGQEPEQISRLIEYRVDGIVCIADNWGLPRLQHWLAEIVEKQIPCVNVDDYSQSALLDCIVTDDVAGAQMAVRHLIGLGHRRIAHLCVSNSTTADDRWRGYELALTESGLPLRPEWIAGNTYDPAQAASAVRDLLDLPTPPTAVFAANDQLAEVVLLEAEQRHLRVPEDLAVVGYGDLDQAQGRHLTTVTQRPKGIGRAAVSRLRECIQDPDRTPERVTLPTELLIRRSCGAKGLAE